MAVTIKILLSLIVLCLPHLTTVECRWKGNVTYTYNSKIWQKNLPDSRKLNTLAFIGTRDPPSFKPSFRRLPRLLKMSEKLTIGIRVFDMGVRRINNDFAMYNSSFDMRAKFSDLVRDTRTYLKKNTKEFVIMIMHAESTAINSTMSECEILNQKYIKKYPNLFVKNWSLDDTIGMHRGKILLVEKSPEFKNCTTLITGYVRDQQSENIQDDFSAHFDYVKSLQSEVNAQRSKCYLFYYTTNREVTVFPREKMTALEKTNWEISQQESQVPQTVGLITTHFNNTKKSLYIIVADLPDLDTVNYIIDSNSK